MNFQKISLAVLKRVLCSALFLTFAWAQAADVFDPETGQVRLDSVVVGSTRYQAVVVVPGTLVGFGSGAPKTTETYFDLASGQLIIRSLTVGPTTYPDVVITIASLVSVGGSAPVQVSGTAPANTLVGLDGQDYPLRVSISLNASKQAAAIAYDFHKTDGSMTPCTHSTSNDATCHGAANTITNITQSAAPTDNSAPNNAPLSAGPDSYGYSFEGKVTGKTWTGTWTSVRTKPTGTTTQSGPFSVDVVIVQDNGSSNPTGSGTASGPNPTILSQTFTPGAAAKLEVAFDIDMREDFGTTGTYVPARSYWAHARLFVLELSSYTPGGNITLVGKSFVSTGGMPLAQDRVIALP